MGRPIDEEEAINAILREYNKDDSDYPTDYQRGLHAAKKIIEQLPSAQSEPSTEIQEILNYLDTTLHPIVSPDNWDVYAELYDMVSRLPSAQPEPLTDKEQRIFLAAMGREEKVCEEVDRNYVNEPYEDRLMRVCKEIRRKVKGALWTI